MHVMLRARPVRQPVEITLGLRQAVLIGCRAMLLAVFVRIETAIEFHDAHVHPLVQQQIDGLFGGVGARRVGVEIHQHPAGVALQRLHLLRGERSAATGHHGGKARRSHTDRIHVTLHQDHAVFLANGLLGAMQVVQHVALFIYRRFRRIQVLGFVVGSQRPPAKANDFARFVVDRKHQAVAETVVAGAVFALTDQAGLLHLPGGKAPLLE